MSTQGKCPVCKFGYRFECPAHLYDAYCPNCGTKLVRTSYLFKGPWIDITYAFPPPGRAEAIRRHNDNKEKS